VGRIRTALFAVTLVTALFAAPAVTLAQQPPRSPDGFVPVESLPQQEQLPAAPLVIAAYAAAWILVFVYVWSIWRRLGRVERELVEVSRRVEAGGRR
jgi:CcmD family protein